jgi:hypothetical protein
LRPTRGAVTNAARSSLVWRQLHWQRPLDTARVASCLRQWAADQRSPRVVLEGRATKAGVTYLLAAPQAAVSHVAGPLRRLLGTVMLPADDARVPVTAVGRLKASTRHRPPALRRCRGNRPRNARRTDPDAC